GRHGICKAKKQLIGMLFTVNAFFNEGQLMSQHFSQARFGHVAAVVLCPINSVTKLFSIGTHRLSYGSGSAAGSKKITHGFLTSTNFRKGSKDALIQVNS